MTDFWDLIFSGLAILSFFLMGLVFDYYFLSRRKLHFNLAIYFGLGLGIVTLFLMLLAIPGIGISRIFVLAVAAFVAAIPVLDKQLGKALRLAVLAQKKKFNFKILLFLVPVILCLGLAAMVTFSHAIWGYDALERWMAKASAFGLRARLPGQICTGFIWRTTLIFGRLPPPGFFISWAKLLIFGFS